MARKGGVDRGLFERHKGSGVWWIRYADQVGKEHKESVGPKKLARTVYQKRKAEVSEGRYFPKRRTRAIPFGEIAGMYLEEHSKVNKPQRSYQEDSYMMKNFKEEFKDKPLREITSLDVERLKAKMAQRVAVATVNRRLTLLKHLFTKAMEWDYVDSNPVKKVKFFKENNARVRYLTEEEEAKLMTALPSYFRPLAVLALHTGLRRGEILGLRWGDVDFRTETLTIGRAKHGESRYIPLNKVAFKTLVALKRDKKVLAPYVFTTEAGKYLHKFERTFLTAVKKAEIENLHFHDLRHTFASRLAMSGAPLRTIQELMGHKTIAMTLRYSHLSPTHLRDIVNKLCGSAREEVTGTKTGTEGISEQGV